MMSLPPPSDHFKGKVVGEHLKEARTKGAIVSSEVHGTEIAGHMAAGADAARETAIALFLAGWILLLYGMNPSAILTLLVVFSLAWLIWKTGRSALLGWTRLERLHRLIEEERYEIEHNREQEKEELRELYEAKGFNGKLLDQVVDVLMADDNRLLRIMLEEELGLTLESYEHPLKQALGAGLGVIITAVIVLMSFHLLGFLGLLLGSAITLVATTVITTKIERNRLLQTLLWTSALALLTGGASYFFFRLFV